MADVPPAPRRAARALQAARFTAQRLSGPPAADVLEATRHLLAVQGQDARGARLALRVRARAAHRADVDHALTVERSLVITWVNRGTLHLIASEDEPLLHALTTPQLRTGNQRRLEQEGVSPAACKRGIAALVKAMKDGPLTRARVIEVLKRARVQTAGQAAVHVLFAATLDGLLVRGPLVDGQQAFVLAADWLGRRPKIARDSALAELARRYLTGHGPADAADLARWAGLPLRDVRAGLDAIASELVQREDGLVDLRKRPSPAPLPAPRLLGPFDPLLLGWRSRVPILGDDATQIVTSNGIFKPIVLVGGRAVGTWAQPAGRVSLDLWARQSATTNAALKREAAAVEAYLAPR